MPKLEIYNTRMLLLMKTAIDAGECKNRKEFYTSLKMYDSAHDQIIKGIRSFTVDQMIIAAKKYKVSIDWICGLTDKMQEQKKETPLEQLKKAVMAIEAAMK